MSNFNDDNVDGVEPDTGGAAPETPEGQADDPETTNLRATEEESSSNEWAP